MKRTPDDETYRRVAAARVGRLATIDDDGRPNLVPFCFVLDGETIYFSVDRKPKTTTNLKRVENILARPDAVTVLVDHYEEDWPKLWWVRLRGTGRVLTGGDEYTRAEALLKAKYEQTRDDPPPAAVVAITIGNVRTWSYT